MKKAMLVLNPDNDNFKEIYEIEGTGQRFYPSKTTKIPVIVRNATEIEIKHELLKLELCWRNEVGYRTIKNKFEDDICKSNNNIALDCCNHSGLMFFKKMNCFNFYQTLKYYDLYSLLGRDKNVYSEKNFRKFESLCDLHGDRAIVHIEYQIVGSYHPGNHFEPPTYPEKEICYVEVTDAYGELISDITSVELEALTKHYEGVEM